MNDFALHFDGSHIKTVPSPKKCLTCALPSGAKHLKRLQPPMAAFSSLWAQNQGAVRCMNCFNGLKGAHVQDALSGPDSQHVPGRIWNIFFWVRCLNPTRAHTVKSFHTQHGVRSGGFLLPDQLHGARANHGSLTIAGRRPRRKQDIPFLATDHLYTHTRTHIKYH